jgi:hypothetical protein
VITRFVTMFVNMSLSMGTPKAVMVEPLRWFAKEATPKFSV